MADGSKRRNAQAGLERELAERLICGEGGHDRPGRGVRRFNLLLRSSPIVIPTYQGKQSGHESDYHEAGQYCPAEKLVLPVRVNSVTAHFHLLGQNQELAQWFQGARENGGG